MSITIISLIIIIGCVIFTKINMINHPEKYNNSNALDYLFKPEKKENHIPQRKNKKVYKKEINKTNIIKDINNKKDNIDTTFSEIDTENNDNKNDINELNEMMQKINKDNMQ